MDKIDWRHGAKHMWDRHEISAIEANEAITDISAVWFDPDPTSRSGRSVRVVGYSYTRKKVLTVILVQRFEESGFWGANGWEANRLDRRRYARGH